MKLIFIRYIVWYGGDVVIYIYYVLVRLLIKLMLINFFILVGI